MLNAFLDCCKVAIKCIVNYEYILGKSLWYEEWIGVDDKKFWLLGAFLTQIMSWSAIAYTCSDPILVLNLYEGKNE